MKNWREDSGITMHTVYKKRFAFFPKMCSDGQKVWFKSYYAEYALYYYDTSRRRSDSGAHTDYIEAHSEETFMIKRLAE